MEKYVHVSGVPLWSYASGSGQPVLLISGGPGVCDYLKPVAGMLERDFQVIRFDPRGCGRSGGSASSYGLDVGLADLEALRVAYGYDNWLVVGHSWGADLGLAYALRYPESARGLVSLSGTGIQNDRDWKEAYTRGKERVEEMMPAFDYPVNKEVHRALINSWRNYIKEPTLLARLSQSQVETLFLTAQKDIRPSWPIAQLAHLMPRARHAEIDGASHYSWIDAPGELQEELCRFLSKGLI